jgi:hypothetical protein
MVSPSRHEAAKAKISRNDTRVSRLDVSRPPWQPASRPLLAARR